jgi:hypothetical protein
LSDLIRGRRQIRTLVDHRRDGRLSETVDLSAEDGDQLLAAIVGRDESDEFPDRRLFFLG